MTENDLPDFGPRKKFVKKLADDLIKNARVIEAPVSLERIIRHLQGDHSIEVQRIDIGEKVSGLLVVCKKVDEDYATIGFNINHSWYRRRFTIAHEIGHFLMGHTCTSRQDDGTHNEREADLFAGEVLIPTKLIKADFIKTPDLDVLSKLYRVSKEALTIKVMDARLLK